MSKKKIAIISGIAVLVVGFIVFNIVTLGGNEDTDGLPRGATPVHWSYPRTDTIVSRVSARGSVELRERTTVFPTTQAQIFEVHVSVGDEVSEGDLLITYDAEILDTLADQLAEARLALRSAELGLAATRIGPAEAEILLAENQIEQARAGITSIESQLGQLDLQIAQLADNIETARDTLADMQHLYDNGVIARVERDSASEAVRRLEDQFSVLMMQRDSVASGIPMAEEAEMLAIAQLDTVLHRNARPEAVNQAQIQQVAIDRAQLAITQIERRIEEFEHEERAAVSGTVLSVFVEPGEPSLTGRPLMEIADVSNENLVITIYVPENEAGGIDVGQEVEISSGAIGNHRYAGYIDLIHPLAAPRQMGGTVETVVTVEISVAETSRLRAGNTVDADIVTGISEDTLVVPIMSTGGEGGEDFVYVITDESVLERVYVTLGKFSAMHIEADGISANSRIVNNPTRTMYDGMIVRPLPAFSPSSAQS
ncbi:MAG: efflux RND transporter periplasmic adaptor subunit [Defluviitaleaceae bacterium]|nr:efflux RND transporter periplasmic adaptor subunit [Defluviitaleaceae bacterium]